MADQNDIQERTPGIKSGRVLRVPWLLGAMIGAGAASAALLAAGVQVWGYPYPRVLLLSSAIYFAVCATNLGGSIVALQWHFAHQHLQGFLSILNSIMFSLLELFFILMASLFFYWASVYVVHLKWSCVDTQSVVCNITIEEASPEQLRQIDDALRAVSFWLPGLIVGS